MNATQNTNPGGMTDAEFLAAIQADAKADGRRIPQSLEEARKPLNTLAEIPADALSERTRFATPGQACGRGHVRKISDKQLAFLRNLLNTRRYHSLMGERYFMNLAKTHNVNSHAGLLAAVEFISLKGASTMIEALLACPLQPAVAEAQATGAEDMATPKQLSFLASLLADKEHNNGDVDLASVTKAEARNMIDALIKAPRKATPAPTKAEVAETIKSVAGIYKLGEDIYRMKKARGGNHFYAELLTDAETGAWEYAKGMARKVPAEGHKLTQAEAEALSSLMGCCCCCGRDLTATVDGVGPAARFIGPICAAKYF